MFDVDNIKVGDYAHMQNDLIGYISSICYNCFVVTFTNGSVAHFYFKDIDKIYPIKLHFKQIGTYKFDEVEKKVERKKIENLDLKENIMNSKLDTMTDFYIMSKLNEVIDRFNAMS